MSNATNRRTQTAKGRARNRGDRDYERVQAMLDLRRGSRTSPVPSGDTYRRGLKHKGRGWQTD